LQVETVPETDYEPSDYALELAWWYSLTMLVEVVRFVRQDLSMLRCSLEVFCRDDFCE
jgi:hypothetical protein